MDCIVQKSFCVLYLVFSIYITGPVMVVPWYNGKCEKMSPDKLPIKPTANTIERRV